MLRKKLWLLPCWLLLVSCINTPTPAPALPVDPVLLPLNPFEPKQLADACADAQPFSLAAAISRALAENPIRPILWTFTVNMEAFSPLGNPLGCFKLYALDAEGKTYAPLSEGFPVDTCQVAGEVEFEAGKARLEIGNGEYIACAMQVGQWAEKINTSGAYVKVKDLLVNFYSSKQAYSNFALIAQVALNFRPEATTLPIAAYYPVPVLVPYEQANSNFDAAILALNLENEKAFLGTCVFPPGTNFYLWYDQQVPAIRHAYQINESPAQICDETTDNAPFRFPLNDGTLYIGANPLLPLETSLDAVVEIGEALVDPADSKPPDDPSGETPTPTATPSLTPTPTLTPTPMTILSFDP